MRRSSARQLDDPVVTVEAIAAVAGGAMAQSRQPVVFFRIQYYDKVRAGSAAPPDGPDHGADDGLCFRMRWIVRGDLDGFFGLALEDR